MLIYEANASGNTFLVLCLSEGGHIPRKQFFDMQPDWTRHDSLLVLAPTDRTMRMRIFEKDGSESAMCGNGSRVSALILDSLGITMPLETGAGHTDTHVSAQHVEVGFMRAVHLGDRKLHRDLPVVSLYSAGGEPHAVIHVPDVYRAPLHYWGSITTPEANCTVVDTRNKRIRARTFERGVNRITRSCGTGATAAMRHVERLGYRHDNTVTMHDETLLLRHHNDQVILGGNVELIKLS